jgi:transcription antitermination factor NusG
MTERPFRFRENAEECKTMGTSKWYAVYTRAHFEKKVHRDLSRDAFKVFLPLVKERRSWSDRSKIIQVPLLPGYVFVKLDSRECPMIMQYSGVVRVVCFEGKPCEVREEEIRLLETIVTHGYKAENVAHVGVGDWVRVLRGPLKGWEGRVESASRQSRIVFQFACIRQCLSVELSMGDVEKVCD